MPDAAACFCGSAAEPADLLADILAELRAIRGALTAGPLPELIDAAAAAALCGASKATWWRWHAAQLTPQPRKLMGKTLWSRTECLRWVAAGCPDRRRWAILQATGGGTP